VQSSQMADNSAADKKAQRQQAAARREQLAPLRKQVKALENQMEKLQTRLDRIESQLGDEAIYAEHNKAKLAELVKEQGSVKAELGSVEEQWLEHQEALEATL
jgi:ATP-binding cassette, subfamily F, member 3